MSDPRHTLRARFDHAIVTAFGADQAGIDPLLRRSQQARFGDYQANVAMSLSKRLASNPRDVAAAIVANLDVAGVCEAVDVAGPGFVNLTLRADYLGAELGATAADARLGVLAAETAETVVVDYSAPNVAKEMHVGHLRSTIIGDALVRVLELLGHNVIRQNHLGDWGTPFGMLIEHLVDLGEEEAAHELSVGDLDGFYRQAQAKFNADPLFAERARLRVVALQSGDSQTLGLWRLLVRESNRYFSAVYERLGVTLTDRDLCPESFYNPMLTDVALELESKGLAWLDDGALCAFPPGFAGRDGEPMPLIVRKRDGGYGYAATDLAAIRYRAGQLGATRLVYVVGSPQSQHLAMVFATAGQAGWLESARAEHVAFGSVLGPDGKMFKTRSGETVKLGALLDEAVERAASVVAEKSPHLDGAERAEVARAVGVGAVKYADLANDRVKDYVFDWDRMLAMDGNTAPYLQYARARVRSIFRRSGESGPVVDGSAVAIVDLAERALALDLLSFDEAVRYTAELSAPHRLCTYLFGLASTFTTFYERCPVLRADTDEQRRSRLVLCDLTARVLQSGLGLLGIRAPDRM
ncbi:MAG TPA: arginine--tRNA ligase [Acidimicrobiales bacterium]|nr:arginine--tRNA ligase [Acidimicrobiales bacterium]